MAHPRREGMVQQLLDELDRPVPVVWDQINDRHDTGIRAIEAFDPTASHHLVLQDDVLVCRDLLAGIERALRYIPQDEPMCLYVGRVKPFAREVQRAVDLAQSASWITMQTSWVPTSRRRLRQESVSHRSSTPTSTPTIRAERLSLPSGPTHTSGYRKRPRWNSTSSRCVTARR